MQKTISPALKVLLEGFIDYAGLYPPAALGLPDALSNYSSYRQGEYAWMLRHFVVGGAQVENVPSALDGHLSILAAEDSQRAATIESTSVLTAEHPVYCEVALNELERLHKVKEGGCLAKIRTGGVKAEAIPSPAQVASFILACADLKLPFKATAGLHHPIRAEQALTYEQDAPRAVMHGFLNVLLASAFAWHGERDIEPVIAEMDALAFGFDEGAHWRGKTLSMSELADTRKNFMHSVGSCSFEEPIQDLKQLGLL